jgi:uncharacterized protein (TIGR00730 family)
MTFPTAKQDADYHAARLKDNSQMQSPAYRLAYHDFDFMIRDELRPVRLQLELLKPELTFAEHDIKATIVILGSARIVDAETAQLELDLAQQNLAENPQDSDAQQAVKHAKYALQKSYYYEQARQLATLITTYNFKQNKPQVVMTGGGSGIMEAANRGAFEAGGKSIGLNIVLPLEQIPNTYITPELCFQFHYFPIRKMHFMMRAKALIAFPGGFGTLDELFEALTLIQSKKMHRIPIILFGQDYWKRIINFDALVEEGAIAAEDLDIIQYAETAEQAWALIVESWTQ